MCLRGLDRENIIFCTQQDQTQFILIYSSWDIVLRSAVTLNGFALEIGMRLTYTKKQCIFKG